MAEDISSIMAQLRMLAEHDDLIRELHSVIRALKWMAALLGVGGTTIGAAANSILGG